MHKQKVDSSVCPLTELCLPTCTLPLWCEEDVLSEFPKSMMNSSVPKQTKQGQAFTDAEWLKPQLSRHIFTSDITNACDSTSNQSVEWVLPSAIFLPFKPAVYRPKSNKDPYNEEICVDSISCDKYSASYMSVNFNTKSSMSSPVKCPFEPRDLLDPDNNSLNSELMSIEAYRMLKLGVDMTVPNTGNGTKGTPPKPKRRFNRVPLAMHGYLNALYVISYHQRCIPPGNYLWELIYPRVDSLPFPTISPTGKYAIKLFVGGAYRKVIIDDRLPIDDSGKCIFPVTERKEIWPALLIKAMIKAVGTNCMQYLLLNPLLIIYMLTGGWMPRILSLQSEQTQVVRTLQEQALRLDRLKLSKASEVDKIEDHTFIIAYTHPNHLLSEIESYTPQDLTNCFNQHMAIFLGLSFPDANLLVHLLVHTTKIEQIPCLSEETFGGIQSGEKSLNCEGWRDVWIDWDTFNTTYLHIAVFTNINSKLYPNCQPLTNHTDILTLKPFKGKPNDNKRDQQAQSKDTSSPSKTNSVAWICIPTRGNVSDITLAYTGYPIYQPRPENQPTESLTMHDNETDQTANIKIEKFIWNSSTPLQTIYQKCIYSGIQYIDYIDIIPTLVGYIVLKLTMVNIPSRCFINIMSREVEIFTVCSFNQVLQLLDINMYNNTGLLVLDQDFPYIMFKKRFDVPRNCMCKFEFNLLEGSSSIPTKLGKKTSKYREKSNVNETSTDLLNFAHSPITRHIQLYLMDNSTNQLIQKSCVGKMLDVALAANDCGYTLSCVCYAVPGVNEPCSWGLSCTSTAPMCGYSDIESPHIFHKEGVYLHNTDCALFHFDISTTEDSYVALSCKVRCKHIENITFKWVVKSQATNQILWESKIETNDAIVPHLLLKSTKNNSQKQNLTVYRLECHLLQSFCQLLSERRQQYLSSMYSNEDNTQTEHCMDALGSISINIGKEDTNPIDIQSKLGKNQHVNDKEVKDIKIGPINDIIHYDLSIYSNNPISVEPSLEETNSRVSQKSQMLKLAPTYNLTKTESTVNPKSKIATEKRQKTNAQIISDESKITRKKYVEQMYGLSTTSHNDSNIVHTLPLTDQKARKHCGITSSGLPLHDGLKYPLDKNEIDQFAEAVPYPTYKRIHTLRKQILDVIQSQESNMKESLLDKVLELQYACDESAVFKEENFQWFNNVNIHQHIQNQLHNDYSKLYI